MCICKICKNSIGNSKYRVREMMFGLREEFDYFQCANCGCLQIGTAPQDLSRYYPRDYFSLEKPKLSERLALFSSLKQARLKHALGQKNALGAVLSIIGGIPSIPEWVIKAHLRTDSRILDVGCGQGQRLLQLRRKGFSSLTGIDPHIASNIRYRCGVTVYKMQVEDITEHFDFVTLNHSFEHMSDPLNTLKKLRDITNPNGYVMIRIPIADSFAWRNYGSDWFQIDAPRHLFLHTRKSMELLAVKAGFTIFDITYDSNEGQFICSEQYKRDIPLMDRRAYRKGRLSELFSMEEIRTFKEKAQYLNSIKEGDSACFYLR